MAIITKKKLNESCEGKNCKVKAFRKPIKEADDEKLSNILKSEHRDVIKKYFDYTPDFEFLDIVAEVLDRIDDYSNEDEIYEAVDSTLIYYAQQWEVFEHYCWSSIADANWEEAYNEFVDDIYSLCYEIAGKSDEDDIEYEDEEEVEVEDEDEE